MAAPAPRASAGTIAAASRRTGTSSTRDATTCIITTMAQERAAWVHDTALMSCPAAIHRAGATTARRIREIRAASPGRPIPLYTSMASSERNVAYRASASRGTMAGSHFDPNTTCTSMGATAASPAPARAP